MLPGRPHPRQPGVRRMRSRSGPVGPPTVQQLAVAFLARAEREQLDSVRATLERADHPRRDADRIERADLDDLVVELDPAGAFQHDVDLLGLVVPVREPLPLAGLDAVVADAGVLGLELARAQARLLELVVTELRIGVLDVGQLLERVSGGHGGSLLGYSVA